MFQDFPDLLNSEQLGKMLGISSYSVQNLTRRRTTASGDAIPHLFIGRRVYFRKQAVISWITSREVS